MPSDDPHPLAGLPISARIDIAIVAAIQAERQTGKRLSPAEIADLAGCSKAAIHARRKASLDAFRAAAARTGVEQDLRSILHPSES